MNFNTLKILFIVDLIVVLFCVILGQFQWLLNTQLAFISSVLVTIGSYYGYKKNVDSRVEDHVNDDDNYDELDKMDDKYDLYSPEVETIEQKEQYSKEEIKEAMKPIKQNYFANFKSGFSGMASFYRLSGYIFLIICFFFLNNNGYLHIWSYMFGFLIVPVASLVLSLYSKSSYNTQS
ncbi:MAG: hypothetical protein K8R39_09420 [Arcobacteraceae bacterium]|nr:hypothetical protein [Arcobacteraceae bacterium]